MDNKEVWKEGMNEDYLDIKNPNLKLAGEREAMKRVSFEMIREYHCIFQMKNTRKRTQVLNLECIHVDVHEDAYLVLQHDAQKYLQTFYKTV